MKPEVIIIVAVTRNFAIGRGGDLLFHISEDLKRFKSLTMGNPIIMGRKTFESFPKGALPGRRNIVVTRNPGYEAPGIERASTIEEALSMCASSSKCFVIGGGEIYAQALPYASKIELTMIDDVTDDADTFFPMPSVAEWSLTSLPEFDRTDPRSGKRYAFLSLERSGEPDKS